MGATSRFAPLWWLLGRCWWLLDASRRVLLNLLLLAVLLALVVGWLTRGPKPLQPRTTLVLDLRGQLVEQFSGSAREQAMAQLRGQAARQTRLRDVLATLDAAARDERITLLALDLREFGGGGQAALREVAAGVARFKASGKAVLAYGEQFDQRQYFLAAQADEIYLHPMGLVMLEGFGRYRNYYKDALDRVGIAANVIRVGRYKNFGEPYFANAPSPASLEAEAYLYGDLWSRFTGAIEQARKLEQGAIAKGIDELPQRMAAAKGHAAQLALDLKLVDGLKTRDEFRALLMARGAKDEQGKSFRAVSFADYQAYLQPAAERGPVVGVVVAEGEIVDGEASAGRVGGDSTAKLVRQAREDDRIKALVLRVNSPGGSAFASEVVRRELELTRQAGKPVVVSMGDVAASGGYWIAMSADEVIADASTVTGSIGVFGMLPTGEKLMDKLSIHTGGTTTAWLAGAYDPRRPLDPRFAALVQSAIQHTYDDFIAKAAAARRRPLADIDAVAQGRVWTGAQALERGLVDRLGSLQDAIRSAAQRAQLQGDPSVRYVEREMGRLERVLASFGDALGPAVAEAVRAQLGLPALPAEVLAAQAELAWVAELRDGRKPFAAVVHCLCRADF